MSIQLFQVYNVNSKNTCVIFDSPHSGTLLPKNFYYDCSPESLYECADLGVDKVLAGAIEAGITCLISNFSRTYVDLNRPPHLQDIHEEWHKVRELNGTSKRIPGQLGTGLIWLRTREPNIELIYQAKEKLPSQNEILRRMKIYYDDYHNFLSNLIQHNIRKFGASYHISWHCCLPIRKNSNSTVSRSDFTISNRFGETSNAEFVNRCYDIIRRFGFSVSVNDELTGGYIIQQYSSPRNFAQSIQIEIVKDLYMNYPSNRFNSDIKNIQAVVKSIAIDIQNYHKR